MPVPVFDYAHLRLTVTDIARSRAFYDSVFGFTVAFEAPPEDADQETKDRLAFVFGGVVYTFGGGVLGLRPVASGDDRFDEDRVGLDHLSFAVASRRNTSATSGCIWLTTTGTPDLMIPAFSAAISGRVLPNKA